MLKKILGKRPEYKFKEPKNTACIVCDHVMHKKRDILFVTHDKDDSSWQFLCGKEDHSESNAKIITMEQATQLDPTINDLFEMPEGVGAERENLNMKWIPFKL